MEGDTLILVSLSLIIGMPIIGGIFHSLVITHTKHSQYINNKHTTSEQSTQYECLLNHTQDITEPLLNTTEKIKMIISGNILSDSDDDTTDTQRKKNNTTRYTTDEYVFL